MKFIVTEDEKKRLLYILASADDCMFNQECGDEEASCISCLNKRIEWEIVPKTE